MNGSSVDMSEPTTQRQHPHVEYAFFAAGHVYGAPGTGRPGLYPRFMDRIAELNGNPGLVFGVFTGDVVAESTPLYWRAAQLDMQRIRVPVLVAPGDHDRGHEFAMRFGRGYHSHEVADDLVIVLDTAQWRVPADQLDFVSRQLAEHSRARYIFIFVHELLWWTPDNRFADIRTNSRSTYPGHSNFWSELAPMLRRLEQRVVIYAGDLGATGDVSHTVFDRFDNLILIGSGMGNGKNDNYVLTEVLSDDSLRFFSVSLDNGARRLLSDTRLSRRGWSTN
ncbi:MAG: hypothetical protein PVF63_00900 [Gammaproteobacteria bacterium]